MISYDPHQYRVEYEGVNFLLERPKDPCELIDLENPDLITPYWADEWPSSEVALKLLPETIPDRSSLVLEIGAGAGTVSIRLNHLFPNYIAADYAPEACYVMEKNRINNKGTLQPLALDWNHSPLKSTIPVIIGIDILYEEEMIEPVIAFLKDHLSKNGKAYLFDPQRFYWKQFKKRVSEEGLTIESNRVEKSSEGVTVEMIIIGRKG